MKMLIIGMGICFKDEISFFPNKRRFRVFDEDAELDFLIDFRSFNPFLLDVHEKIKHT